MDAVQSNVTDINQFSRDRKNAANVTPLDQCRETAALGLTKSLTDSLRPVTARLFTVAEQTASRDAFRVYMEALELARDRSTTLTTAFRTGFLQRFNLACRHEARQETSRRNPEAGLSLVEPDDLEESLAAETLSNAIYNHCGEELFGLDKRIGMLINDPELRQGKNPVGPEAIADALADALRDQPISIKARLLLVSLLNKELPGRIKSVYQDVNENLVRRGVLPAIRVGLRKSTREPTSAEPPSSQAAASDIFAALGQMLRQATSEKVPGNSHGIIPPPMPGEPGFNDRFDKIQMPTNVHNDSGYASAFLQALNHLQHGRGQDTGRSSLDLSAIAGGQVNVLHGLRDSGIAASMAPVDSMTLDIVAMMFDYILDDARIPDAIKALIGRLQIPILKVAVLDKTFFSQRTHPARHLLDTLAESAIGWDPAEGHESGLYRKVEQLIQHILDRFEDRVEIFAEALTELDAFLDEEKRLAERQINLRARFISARELDSVANQAAHDELHSRLLGQYLPEVMREFLLEHWQGLLVELHQKAGMNSEAWIGALQTVDDLVWSVQPKSSQDERVKLVRMLPGLLLRLDEGIRFMALTKEERDRFLANLVRIHAAAVKADQPDASAVQPKTSSGVQGLAESQATSPEPSPALATQEEFQPVPLVAGPADEDELPPLALNMPDSDPVAVLSGDDSLPKLKRGSWIEYRAANGEPVRVKLSWVSPLGGIYLFTNRLGQRAISIGAAGLAAKLRSGEVTLIDDFILVDHAVDQLMGSLQRKAG